QWMPRPPAISRQAARSSAVACAKRGYQASGAAMVRPSANSTDKVSSLTATPVAKAARLSAAEERMPTLQQLRLMLLDQLPDAIDFLAAEAVAALQPYRVEPELRLAVVALNRDVRRLATVTDVEEEVERPAAERRRHAPMLPRPAPPSNAGHD